MTLEATMSPVPPKARWRMRDGIAVVPTDRGLIFEGGMRRSMLLGAAAVEMLPGLIALLDGRHDDADLREELGLSEAQLGQLLSPLVSDGLVEKLTATPAGPKTFPSPPRHVAAFVARSREILAGDLTGDQFLAALNDAAVLVLGPDRERAMILADLLECGVGQLAGSAEATDGVIASWVSGLRSGDDTTGRSLVIFTDEGMPLHSASGADALATVVDQCARYGVPVMRCAVADDRVELGPLFVTGHSGCVRCFRHSQNSLPAGAATMTTEAADLMAGMVTGEALRHLGRSDTAVWRRMAATSLPAFVTTWYEVVPEPDCAECWGPVPPGATAVDAETYEWLSELSPREFQAVVSRSPAELKRLSDLRVQRGTLPASPRITMPAQASTRPPGSAPAVGLDLGVLGALLQRVAGYRDAAAGKRWAPSGGNLASPEAYLVVDGGIPDLPGTVFKYDDINHALISVHCDDVSLDRVLPGDDGSTRPAAALILVGGVGRISEKYKQFARRLAHLDAGCALAQLSFVARAFGTPMWLAAGWDPSLPALLDLNTDRQVVTAVAVLGRPE